jgi:hypothetical protein
MAAKGPAPVLIRPSNFTGQRDSKRLFVIGGCLILSFIVHVVAVCMLFLVNVQSSNADTAGMENSVIETKVEDAATKPPDLENDEIGNDPEVPTNYDNNRIETVSVPGAVNVDQAAGIKDAPEGLATTLPPPPGFGDSRGQGGGVESDKAGAGNLVGFAGGMGGPRLLAGGFGGRSGATRQQMVQEGGGNTQSEAAVAAGLKWMAAHQAPDGHWSLDGFNQHGHCNCTGFGTSNDIAGTAFGLLPFLGAGQTHKGTGEKGSIYAKNVERGLSYLLGKQSREGDFGGGMYSHGLATIAVCEAYGLTSDPRLKTPAQHALNFIVGAQNGKGGWDYGPRGPRTDTSVGGWQLMGLKSGQMAGLEVPTRAMSGAARWLDGVKGDDVGSGYGYDGPGETPTMTAVGLLCREYLGWGPRNPGLAKGVQKLLNWPPGNQPTMYYHYYATQVVHHIGGAAWEAWNPKMRDLLIAKQDKGDAKHPHHKGSWSPAGDSLGSSGGRIMVSSLSLLTLEVYYRHLPLYRREMGTNK